MIKLGSLLFPILTLLTSGLHAAPAEAISKAVWTVEDNKAFANVTLAELLTKKQRNMIEGGFTTFSELTVYVADGNQNPSRDRQLMQIRCSVKYDAWEEIYDVAKLSGTKISGTHKNFDDYASLCLSLQLAEGLLTGEGILPGQMIIAELLVVQASLEEEQKIKQWLVQQQSGVMQTLFQHMLGELSLNQNLLVRVNLPPKPSVPASAPGKG